MTTVTFVGAGSIEFTRQLLRDLLNYPELRGTRMVLHDVDPDRLSLAEALARTAIERHGGGFDVRSSLDRKTALDGADFVVNMVAIGGHPATVSDFDVPERYGLRQTIGDTLGVGGIFRALRTFPFLRELAVDMAAVCPDAWLLNYTNPMAMNIGYLSSAAPALKALGLCHSLYWTVHDLCELVGVPLDEVTFTSAGVNHQAWVLRWERHGANLYPLLDALIESQPELRRRVRVDMYRRLGFYPTETSEHSSEYVPWYLRNPAEVERLRIPLRDYVGISAANVAEYERLRAEAARGHFEEPQQEAAEYAPQVIHSMVTGTPRVIQVTTPNTGLITNLPHNAAVEVPCVVDSAGARPIHVGELPPQCAALNRNFLNVVDLVVRAAVEESPEHIRHAAMVDPSTAATLTVDEIWRLCDDMVRAHGDRLAPSLRTTLAS